MPTPDTEVLLVDDSRADQRFITRALGLARSSFHVDAAGSMAEARAKLEQKKYDCLLVDYNLPDANGLQLVREYCCGREAGQIGMVLITGAGNEKLAAEAIKLGAHDYLSKDQMNGSVLARAVDNAVQKSRMQRNLSHQQLIMEHFASSAAHDLANPLNGVIGFITLARQQLGGLMADKVPDYLDSALASAEYMRHLVEDLLHYARTGTASEAATPVDLSDTMDLATKVLENTILDAGARLEVGAMPVIEGYATELVQLFQNLIANAIKYRSDTRPRIRIWAEEQENHWQIAVEDNGIGIPSESAEDIFAPLHRLRKKEVAGFGLGLAICAKITDLHGGRIWCEPSALTGGSIFKVTLAKSLQTPDFDRGKSNVIYASNYI
ncbi:MAG: response regulator [Alphaproteobacteria bacterium]|nr:MAG: response regulator [Alphaproteobacteria bacterium]